MKNYELTAEERAAAAALYSILGINSDEDSVESDIEHDYLTVNTGRDGNEYVWYLDPDGKEGAIRVDDHHILSVGDIIRLLGDGDME